jgi:hypothetical protein
MSKTIWKVMGLAFLIIVFGIAGYVAAVLVAAWW